MVSIDTTLPNHKWIDFLKKVININLLFFNNKFFILYEFFYILNFLTLCTTFETFWHLQSYSDKLSLTPHHILFISNLILSRNKRIQCGNKYLVLCTVSKWRLVVGAKWMAPTACPARVWTLGTRWTTLTQNGWVLWFTCFKNAVC